MISISRGMASAALAGTMPLHDFPSRMFGDRGLCEMEIPTGHCLSVLCGREASVGSVELKRDVCRKCWETYCE